MAVTKTAKRSLPFIEFVFLVSLLMSLTALSIDAMLPALSQIGADLGIQNPNNRQLVVSLIFFGMALGQLFFGPLSDTTGRKTAMFAGFGCYILGSLTAAFALNFPMLLTGRLLQGFGVSAPRAVTLAIVRDRHKGETMARVMSFVMSIFILVPMIAPTMGQAILKVLGWRSIFGSFIVIAVIALLWFGLRMPETLAPGNRSSFSLRHIGRMIIQIIKTRTSFSYIIVAGFVSGAHIGYLNSAQQIFQEQYALGNLFPLYFALIALSIALATLSNARLVTRFGMRVMVRSALFGNGGLSVVFFFTALLFGGHPPLRLLLIYLLFVFFGIGVLMGNLNALAMEPLGHIAGVGAAIVGSLSTLLSVLLGTFIGQSYNGTVLPLVGGLAVLSILSIGITFIADAGSE